MLSRLRIGTKIAASFALGLAIFVAIAAVSYRGINRSVETAQREAHTYQVIGQLQSLNGQIKGAETSQRGYLVAGEARYLSPYNMIIQALDETLLTLRQLTQDHPAQQQRVAQLERLVEARVARMQKTIDIFRQQGFEAAQREVQTDEGKQLSDQIDQLVSEMMNEERRLLEQRAAAAQRSARWTLNSILYSIPIYAIGLATIGLILARNISRPLRQIASATERVGKGDLSTEIPLMSRRDEIGILNNAFHNMVISLRETTHKNDEQGWLKSNVAEFTQLLQGRRDLITVARLILSELVPLVEAQQGAFYVLDGETAPPLLKLVGSYAYQERKHLNHQFHLGESLVGQCALEKQRILLTDVPGDYIQINSGLGSAPPLNIVVLPVLFEGEVAAVIELASLQRFSDIHLTLLDQVTQNIGVVLNTIASDIRTTQLLEQAQALAEELQIRQEELEAGNHRLEAQAKELRQSEALLKEQQEELQQTNEELQQLNEELEEKAELLTLQKREVEQKNQEIEKARQEILTKAEQLALSSKYTAVID